MPRRWWALAIIAAVAGTAIALALGQNWLAAADLLPLLYVLPCAAMMFACMRGHMSGQQQDTTQAQTGTAGPVAGTQN